MASTVWASAGFMDAVGDLQLRFLPRPPRRREPGGRGARRPNGRRAHHNPGRDARRDPPAGDRDAGRRWNRHARDDDSRLRRTLDDDPAPDDSGASGVPTAEKPTVTVERRRPRPRGDTGRDRGAGRRNGEPDRPSRWPRSPPQRRRNLLDGSTPETHALIGRDTTRTSRPRTGGPRRVRRPRQRCRPRPDQGQPDASRPVKTRSW